ncbi:MAG: DNA glycosylase [Candidatus Bathyarchaeia archaeon]
MKILLSRSCPFNLDVTLCCGQVFRWDKMGEWWFGVTGEKVFKIRQIGEELEFENADEDFVREYFGLKDDLPKILSQISKDKHVKTAIVKFKGLRILRQDPWECLISYICATYKNIPAIKKMLLNLSRKFGEKAVFEGRDFYTFPTPETLAKANKRELLECGLGYRAEYVLETAKMVHNGNSCLEDLKKANYLKARSELLKLPGVGSKVADCVSLFSLEKLEAFPVDVWIKRIILKYYADHFESEFTKKILAHKSFGKAEYEKMSLFGRKYFGEYAGYAQEYLYHYERMQHQMMLLFFSVSAA